ncbi:glycoside hydrolase family 2 protein [Pelagibacterium sediminicola]|uniref:glycoside hydrolase family 2 protein n=1 Tax=Pelagibacterium sediminicola TaxID=2248761 RepID=UPI001FE6F9F0|nr:glycoside hydrolase family 2 TIM barrel-domain containing protein [Pelagibacterium sediminicola]
MRRNLIDFSGGWMFEGQSSVRLPHNAVDLPLTYFDETAYQRAFTYEKRFTADPDWRGQEIAVVFEAAMADARVALNGEEIARHSDGYTPFEARLTGRLRDGENVLSVTVDGSENPRIPPFGGQIDYLTYAGLYREAWVRVTAPVFLSNCKVETPDPLAAKKSVQVRVEISNPQGLTLSGTVTARLLDGEGREVAIAEASLYPSPKTLLRLRSLHWSDWWLRHRLEVPQGERGAQEPGSPGYPSPLEGEGGLSRSERSDEGCSGTIELALDELEGIALWDIGNPALYTLELVLETPHGRDKAAVRFGFRSAEFRSQGFFLNGRHLKLRGLNRHQSFPYVGYALGRSAQERDAEILKRDLKLNIVRTAHYPQSPWFLDRCDELGLLVFEEIPGWQHIGGKEWKDEAVENVRRMIARDWNHPAIVLWGVRINESRDDHEFYTRTNALAHELDSTRQTGGVRFLAESELIEDVYTINDFVLGEEELGGNRPRTPLRPPAEVTGLAAPVPYLVTEYNGHMFPTKSFDPEQRQAEHVLRHLEVLDAAYGDPQIAGAIGWCAFDYNTHKDFGAGDRICHHGVMDMFREPKFAAFAYASQCEPEDEVIVKPVTHWARGERNAGGILPLMVLTNCEEIEIAFGSEAPRRFLPDRKRFPHLPHPPVMLERDDFSAGEFGAWGTPWEGGTITGLIGGRPVKTVRFVADPVLDRLEVAPDRSRIGVFDAVRVAVRARDQAGNILPWLFEPVTIGLEGPAELIGPSLVSLRGGTTAFWLRATGPGTAMARVESGRGGVVSVEIAIEDGS